MTMKILLPLAALIVCASSSGILETVQAIGLIANVLQEQLVEDHNAEFAKFLQIQANKFFPKETALICREGLKSGLKKMQDMKEANKLFDEEHEFQQKACAALQKIGTIVNLLRAIAESDVPLQALEAFSKTWVEIQPAFLDFDQAQADSKAFNERCKPCDTCDGKGTPPDSEFDCETCGGKGRVLRTTTEAPIDPTPLEDEDEKQEPRKVSATDPTPRRRLKSHARQLADRFAKLSAYLSVQN